MSEFATWREARDAAEALANKLGISVGIEKLTAFQGWTIKLLPRPENRCGWELRCECVDPVQRRA
jgi:hypothetical protein